MNSFMYSFKNLSSEFVESANFVQNKRPNQFCLKIFNQQSYEDFKLEEQQQPSQQQFQDQYPQLSISQYFLNPQLSLELKSKLPSLDRYIKKRKYIKGQITVRCNQRLQENICRNILRHSIKGIVNSSSQEFLLDEFRNNNQKLIEFQKFYQQNLEIISGFRVLKDHLIIQGDEPKEEQERKSVFKNIQSGFCPLRQQNAYCNQRLITSLNISTTKMMSYYIMSSSLRNGTLTSLYGEKE